MSSSTTIELLILATSLRRLNRCQSKALREDWARVPSWEGGLDARRREPRRWTYRC
ncbi:hypothetical protein L210DRAFT_937631, partial [Boletus edulis BED1]